MYNFAPAVFIYDYLVNTNLLTEQLENKALLYIQTGYQRELEYRNVFISSNLGDYEVTFQQLLHNCFKSPCAFITTQIR